MDNTPSKSSWHDSEKRVMDAFHQKDYCAARDILIRELKTAQLLRELPSGLIDLVHSLATVYCLERQYDKAEHLYTSGLAVREKILGPNHPDIIDSLERLAIVIRETQGNSVLAKTIAFRARYLAKCTQVA